MTKKITNLAQETVPADPYLEPLIEHMKDRYGPCHGRIHTIERHEEDGVVWFPKERVALYFTDGTVLLERSSRVSPPTWTLVRDIEPRPMPAPAVVTVTKPEEPTIFDRHLRRLQQEEAKTCHPTRNA